MDCICDGLRHSTPASRGKADFPAGDPGRPRGIFYTLRRLATSGCDDCRMALKSPQPADRVIIDVKVNGVPLGMEVRHRCESQHRGERGILPSFRRISTAADKAITLGRTTEYVGSVRRADVGWLRDRHTATLCGGSGVSLPVWSTVCLTACLVSYSLIQTMARSVLSI